MSHQENNFEEPEEELESNLRDFSLPGWLKWVTTMVASIIVIFTVAYTWKYLVAPNVYVSPSELSLSNPFLFALSAIILVWFPWDKLGIRISKIGGIEFRDVVETQATEHTEDITYLKDRIEYLESYVRENDELAKIEMRFQGPELRELLTNFLTVNKKWAFSPSRIKLWGSKQQGFSKLSDYNHETLKSTLQKMVSEDILETRISKKGNTLYRIPLQ